MQKKVEVYDIEVFPNFFSYTGLDIHTGEVSQFYIHESKNQIKEFTAHVRSLGGMIGYNNVNYDYPIVHYMLTNSWVDDPSFIVKALYAKSQEMINSEFTALPYWKEIVKQLDLYRVWHFDNKAKRTSLKDLEIAMRWKRVQDLPFKYDYYVKTEDIPSILEYNTNDVLATNEFYKITKGDTDNPLYKGADKVQLRKDIMKRFGIYCVNFNDVKIGDEINKLNYLNSTGLTKNDLWNMKTDHGMIKASDCIVPLIHFESEQLQTFLKDVKAKIFRETRGEFSESVVYKGVRFTFGQGGIHTVDKGRRIEPKDNEILEDRDCALT